MRSKVTYLIFTLCFILFSNTIKASSSDPVNAIKDTIKASPSDSVNLIKVAPENNIKCVDYYSYKGQLYCSTTPNPQPVDPHLKDYENLSIQFDDRPWKIGWGKKDDNATMIEYVPQGEDIENWHELVTSQFFPGLQEKLTPKEFADLYIEKWKNDGYKPTVTYLKNTPDQVIIDLILKEPENQAQDELLMITSDDEGLYLLHYAVKNPNMSQAEKDKWVQNLMKSTIKEGS